MFEFFFIRLASYSTSPGVLNLILSLILGSINLFYGLERFNRGLALIGFGITGASISACAKTRNNETKRPKWAKRAKQNHRNERNVRIDKPPFSRCLRARRTCAHPSFSFLQARRECQDVTHVDLGARSGCNSKVTEIQSLFLLFRSFRSFRLAYV